MNLAHANERTSGVITPIIGLILEDQRTIDTDSDGLPDEWELMFGLDPINPADAFQDGDDDGLYNLQEFRIGLDPTAPDANILFLNDTGITFSGPTTSGSTGTCNSTLESPQDCEQGRDTTLGGVDGGRAGFSFTKLDSTGANLGDDASEWACVKDNHTRLIWEVKTNDGGIHDAFTNYRWGGISAQGSGFGNYHGDWDILVNTSNNASFCGQQDWRVPTLIELHSIASLHTTSMTIDKDFFPNTRNSLYWSSNPSHSSTDAWYFAFANGSANFSVNRGNRLSVILVANDR